MDQHLIARHFPRCPSGFGPWLREYLIFHRTTGDDFAFKEFNRSPRHPERSSVREAAEVINSRLG